MAFALSQLNRDNHVFCVPPCHSRRAEPPSLFYPSLPAFTRLCLEACFPCHVVFTVLLALVLARALMSHGCGFAASDTLVRMMTGGFTNQRARVETTAVRHETAQDDDVLHAALRKRSDTKRPLVSGSCAFTLAISISRLLLCFRLAPDSSGYLIRSARQGHGSSRILCGS